MPDAWLLSAARTPIGAFGGVFRDVSAVELGRAAVVEALRRANVDGQAVAQVVLGNVLQAGQGQNPARQVAVAAGIPVQVPAMTINMVCASGLQSVALAALAVRSGETDLVVAGGMENMSRAPLLADDARWGRRLGDATLRDCILLDGLVDAFDQRHMGVLCEDLGCARGIDRAAMDSFALDSQRKCAAAVAAGRFDAEIVPMEIAGRSGFTTITADEFPKPETTLEALQSLKPAFAREGAITAGNASGINDGAAAVVVASEAAVEASGVEPLARVVASAAVGRTPAEFGLAPADAVRAVLDRAGLSVADMDVIESNEAFAVQALAVSAELGWDETRVNLNGGAIALGHPIGASGARVLTTLLYELRRRAGRYGLATLCVGGGMGIAMIVERSGSTRPAVDRSTHP